MNVIAWVQDHLQEAGLEAYWASTLAVLVALLSLLLIAALSFAITKRLLLAGIQKLVARSRVQWDDVLLEKKFFSRLAHIFPALIILQSAPFIFPAQDQLELFLVKSVNVYLVVMVVLAVFSMLHTGEHFLSRTRPFQDQPIGSYFQLGRIVFALVGGILVLSISLDKSPLFFLSTFGAMTAVILLVFRDTILGFVASIQIAANDMVHIGDWVEMPKFEANGDVIQITLATIKIKNFDQTISHIPTYAFISESFRNWQGMKRAGGRRIKRAIHLKQSSVRFCSAQDLERYQRYELIRTHIDQQKESINPTSSNGESSHLAPALINEKQLTNLGLFRRYAETYLQQSEHIHQSPPLILMVRQLSPGPNGIPIEVYCFSRDTRWVVYEKIQADIFDHLIAAVKFFDLEIFEYPSAGATAPTAGLEQFGRPKGAS